MSRAAAAAAALRPRPEPDPGECGPATLARPRPGLGDRAPRSLAGPGSRRAGRSHSRSPLSAPACRVPSPAAPRPRAVPPGPPSPPPLAGPGQKMVQKKTAELQGFHRSFKVRAGWVWGRLGLDHSSGRWGARSPPPGFPPPGGSCLPPHPGSGAAPTGCALGGGGGQWATVQAPAPWGLLGSFLQEPQVGPGARSLWGHLAVCPLQTPAGCALPGSSAGRSPVLSALGLWVCGVFPPGIRGRAAGPQSLPTWSTERGSGLDAPQPCTSQTLQAQVLFPVGAGSFCGGPMAAAESWSQMSASGGGGGQVLGWGPTGLAQGTQ